MHSDQIVPHWDPTVPLPEMKGHEKYTKAEHHPSRNGSACMLEYLPPWAMSGMPLLVLQRVYFSNSSMNYCVANGQSMKTCACLQCYLPSKMYAFDGYLYFWFLAATD